MSRRVPTPGLSIFICKMRVGAVIVHLFHQHDMPGTVPGAEVQW